MPKKIVEIVDGVSAQVCWWLEQRLKKLRGLSHETMTVNPLMAPLLVGLHSHQDFDELADFLLGGHFMVGHATGFGKLVDEKILPNVFGSTKLDKSFRRNAPYNLSMFSEIDHIQPSFDGHNLLSLKASRWTIQLTMAMQLNKSFSELIDLRTEGKTEFNKILLGVYYGKKENLTDKFQIARGICTGAQHDVVDVSDNVEVVAGREFWAWVNDGESLTQDWVMTGVLEGLRQSQKMLSEAKGLLEKYKAAFVAHYQEHVSDEGINWHEIIRGISG